jgi:hypothetical protein
LCAAARPLMAISKTQSYRLLFIVCWRVGQRVCTPLVILRRRSGVGKISIHFPLRRHEPCLRQGQNNDQTRNDQTFRNVLRNVLICTREILIGCYLRVIVVEPVPVWKNEREKNTSIVIHPHS